jgi:hypothetical protein
MTQFNKISSIRHPRYWQSTPDWDLWRSIQDGGEQFIETYVKRFSKRESMTDFKKRKEVSPVQGFAKTAVTDIKNAVFQRMGDIVRKGGSSFYMSAVAGFKGGVDRHGSSMNNFIGTQVLPEMLFMGQVGVFIDTLTTGGPTLADAQATPYLYTYPVEDILSVTCSPPGAESDFQAILVRDWCTSFTQPVNIPGMELPSGRFQRLRACWIDPDDGFVRCQFFNAEDRPITQDGIELNAVDPIVTDLRRIPFVVFDIGTSLLQGIARHQIALTNLASSDISWCLKANVAMYVEQQDRRATGSHLGNAVMDDGTATTGGQASNDQVIEVGGVDGRIYAQGMDQPDFIHPSAEPLLGSLKLQANHEDAIRKLVNLAVVSLGSSRASGEARAFDNQGLESGLAFIGMVLENNERKIANHWASYEGDDNQDSVVVKYPERYSLKTAEQRLDEADKLTSLMFSIPGQKVKKELAKDAVIALFGGRTTPEVMETLLRDVDSQSYSTSDLDVIALAAEHGFASDVTLSDALGFDGDDEITQARLDHAARIARIQAAQSNEEGDDDDSDEDGSNPGARGVDDLDPSGGGAAKQERAEATDTTLRDSTQSRQRGRGRRSRRRNG